MGDLKNCHRRRFLQFLAGSPLLAGAVAASDEACAERLDPDLEYILSLTAKAVSSPHEALNVFDLEAVARKTLPPAHYGYIATGAGDEATQLANRRGFQNLQLRMRRLKGAGATTQTTLFGKDWRSPLGLAPCGSLRALHPEAEVAAARAARAGNVLQILSAASTTAIEDVNEARGEPVWFQLYPLGDWPSTVALLKRVERAGAPVIVVTVDHVAGEKRETLERLIRMDKRDCTQCHGPEGYSLSLERRPMFDNIDPRDAFAGAERFQWAYIDRIADFLSRSGNDEDGAPGPGKREARSDLLGRLRDNTRVKLVIKGIVTGEDAALCVKHGMDGVIVSNHGGREDSTGRASIESLREVVSAVKGKIPVMMDGGVRRGADIFKALALGADKVFIGRPYLWGLGGFGQEGVGRVIDLLQGELLRVMKQAGVSAIEDVSKAYVVAPLRR